MRNQPTYNEKSKKNLQNLNHPSLDKKITVTKVYYLTVIIYSLPKKIIQHLPINFNEVQPTSSPLNSQDLIAYSPF